MVCWRPGSPEAADRRERQELLRIYQKQKGMMGKVCVWDRFVLIGGFSGASGREELQSGITRAVSAHFLFPEDKIKAGNAFVNDWPEPICAAAAEPSSKREQSL